jgi:integrase/recombinase XerD
MNSKRRVLASMPHEQDDELERVLAGYRSYLLFERGVSTTTADCYEPRARRFLAQREGMKGLGLDRLTATDVSRFLTQQCPLRGAAEARMLVLVVRSVLRYLHLAGLITVPLEWAVPGVAAVRDRALPSPVEPEVVAALLSSCDRRRTVGRRDYAILLLLVRLGLRAGEVGRICLGDINWRVGEILIHGKGGREDILPLPPDVGEALADYLRSRPPGPKGCRALFLKVLAPVGPMSRSTVSAVVREACLRIGIERVCPHRLRHTAASRMLLAGASLEEIGQVLRHREHRTTAVYARVDRDALRTIAQPWPEAAS